MTTTEYTMKDGTTISYDIFDDGFDIWIGDTDRTPTYRQREPFIPDKSKSYEENAISMIEKISNNSNNPKESSSPIDDRLTNIEANIDYLMLLNDADSIDASEE